MIDKTSNFNGKNNTNHNTDLKTNKEGSYSLPPNNTPVPNEIDTGLNNKGHKNTSARNIIMDLVSSTFFRHLKYVYHTRITKVKKEYSSFPYTGDPVHIDLVKDEENITIEILAVIWEHKKAEFEKKSNSQLNETLNDLFSVSMEEKPDFEEYFLLYEEIQITGCPSFALIQTAVFDDEDEAAANLNKDNALELDLARLDVSISEAAAAAISSEFGEAATYFHTTKKKNFLTDQTNIPQPIALMEQNKEELVQKKDTKQEKDTDTDTVTEIKKEGVAFGGEALAGGAPQHQPQPQPQDTTAPRHRPRPAPAPAPAAVLLKQSSSTKPFDLWECCVDISNESSDNPQHRHAFRLTETKENRHLFEDPGQVVEIITSIRSEAVKYIFQMERGQNSERYYQGYIRFNKKVRRKQLYKQLKQRFNGLNNAIVFAFAVDDNVLIRYCQKKQSRIDGPWGYPPDAF